jgi:hypothetical protein
MNRTNLGYTQKLMTTLRKVIAHLFVLYMVGMALLLSESRGNAQGNLVQNGDFNEGLSVWGWTYNFGILEGVPYAAEGGDIGLVDGTLFQTLQTTPGQAYQLQFAMAGTPNDPATEVLDVLWGGQSIVNLSWYPAGHSYSSGLGWEWIDIAVTASTSSTVLSFDNPNLGTNPFLDAVSVKAIPEPSTIWLLSFGLFAIFVRRKSLLSSL